MIEVDTNNSVAVTREIHWVGYFDEESSLHCNPYLLIDEEEAVFIDPGSIPHFPVVMRKVIDLINPKDISTIITSHQDPDVCGNLAVVEDLISRADLKIIAHTNTIRLVRHYGLNAEFFSVDQNDFTFQLKSGRVLTFIFIPFLHSPGAIMTYDAQTKTLFSGDLFGAVSKNWSLFARGDFCDPMGDFHRLYMPGNRELRRCMERIELLDVERILPQHGSVLEGSQVKTAIAFLKELPCGLDLEIEGV